MLFIWRGMGIIVPIIFLITGWIVSYWFDDTRLGNTIFLGWTAFYTGIIVTVLGLGANTTDIDGETGKVLPKAKHDFFFIPILLWGLFLLGLGIYWIWLSPVPSDEYNSEFDSLSNIEELLEEMDDLDTEYLSWRYVNVYNGTTDTVSYTFYSDIRGDEPHEGSLEGKKFDQIKVKEGNYCVQSTGQNGELILNQNDMINADLFKEKRRNWIKEEVRRSGEYIYKRKVGPYTYDSKDYDEAWICIDSIHNFVLIDIKAACEIGMEEEDFEYIDWERRIIEWYDGRDLIEPLYNADRRGMTIKIIGPWLRIPITAKNNEKIYAIISYEKDEVVDQEFLQKRIARLYSFNYED